MTKRPSEAEFGAALREVDLVSYVFRPPDPKLGAGVSNWKPCDFMAWHRLMLVDDANKATYGPFANPSIIVAGSTWFECKDVTAVESFAFAELRPSQLAGIRDAERVGIPYWLAVWWRRQKEWTISDASRVLLWREEDGASRGEAVLLPTSIPRNLLESRFGVSCARAQLASTLKQVLLGEAS